MVHVLEFSDLAAIKNAESLARLFVKQGYDDCFGEFDVEDLELSETTSDAVEKVYLIAQNSTLNLQVVLFELKEELLWENNEIIKRRLSAIANNLSNRPSEFLIVATIDYYEIKFIKSTINFDQNMKLTKFIKYGEVDISPLNRSFFELHLLQQITSLEGNTEDIKNRQIEIINHSISRKERKKYEQDSLRQYFYEIGRLRLLSAEEEIELARKIAELLEFERVRNEILENSGKEPTLKEWAAAVDLSYADFRRRLFMSRRAKDKMVQSNLRLGVSIAKKYQNRGLDFQDLIQEGSLGLIRAAEKFDPTKGYKFSTYATWWIRQGVTRAIADQSRLIRLPVHVYETISRIKKTTKLLSQEIDRKPTEQEIADRMEMTIEKLRFIAKSAQLPTSLEMPAGKEENSCFGDFIEDDKLSPEDLVTRNLLREDLESVLDTLSPRERDVLRLRYGLDDGRMKTLEEIGQIFNVTRERIRQIEAKALRKLRHPNRNSILKEYICSDFDCSPKQNDNQVESDEEETKIKVVENTTKLNHDIKTENIKSCYIEDFRRAISVLSPNEKQILDMLYGANNGVGMSYKGACAFLGISEQTILEIEEKALKNLRISENSKVLQKYILNSQSNNENTKILLGKLFGKKLNLIRA